MKMHPMVRIPLRTCMMIYMVHLTNQMARKAPIPNIDEIMRQNPDIARQLAAASMQAQTQNMRTTQNIPPPAAPPAGAFNANPLAGLMGFMQGHTVPAPPPPTPNVIPRPPAADKAVKIGGIKKAVSVAPPPAPKPQPEMKGPAVSIDDLLKEIKSTVVSPGPPPPAAEKVGKSPRKAGSTGKNSVVIKL